MKRRFLTLAIVAALLVCMTGCALAEGTGEKRILVVETTDIHGYIMDVSSGNEDNFQ